MSSATRETREENIAKTGRSGEDSYRGGYSEVRGNLTDFVCRNGKQEMNQVLGCAVQSSVAHGLLIFVRVTIS